METAKIEATISEQGLRTEIMGQGRDVVSCIAAVMNTFAEGIIGCRHSLTGTVRTAGPVVRWMWRTQLHSNMGQEEGTRRW